MQLHRCRVMRWIRVPTKGLPLQPHFPRRTMMSRNHRWSHQCHRLSCPFRQLTRGFVVSWFPPHGGSTKYRRKCERNGKTRPHESQWWVCLRSVPTRRTGLQKQWCIFKLWLWSSPVIIRSFQHASKTWVLTGALGVVVYHHYSWLLEPKGKHQANMYMYSLYIHIYIYIYLFRVYLCIYIYLFIYVYIYDI